MKHDCFVMELVSVYESMRGLASTFGKHPNVLTGKKNHCHSCIEILRRGLVCQGDLSLFADLTLTSSKDSFLIYRGTPEL